MMKKLISSFTAFVMVAALVLAIPVMAAGVPDELKTDYVPGADGNLITKTISVGTNVTANDSAVTCVTNNGVTTMTAGKDITTGWWGSRGFVVNNDQFIADKPTFVAGDKLLFSARVKLDSTTPNATAYVNFVHTKNPSASATFTWTDTYSDDGLNVTGTDWVEFKSITTVPENASLINSCGGAIFGLSKGTLNGAMVNVSVNDMFYGIEKAYDINVNSNGATEFIQGAGGTFSADAHIVNQIGNDFSGGQGDFNWYALNADRTAVAEGITVTPGENGTATVTVSPNASGGAYDIIAVSDTYEGFVKGTTINVVSVADYVPGEIPENLIADVATALAANSNSTQVTYTSYDDYVVLKANNALTDSGTAWPYHGVALSRDGLKKTTLADGTNIVFSAQVKSLSEVNSVTACAGFYDSRTTPLYSNEYPTDADGLVIDSAGWKTFAASYTIREDFAYDEWVQPVIGMIEGTPAGAELAISKASGSMYLGVEEIYDITNKPVGTSIVEAGKDSTVTYKAQIVNQLGFTGAITQGTFTWSAMDESKTAFVDGIDITPNADGTATINVSKDTPVGVYKIVANSDLYPDYVRSYPLVVTDGSIVHSIYVSPDGNDDGEGTFSAPLKTVQAARDLARQYITEGKQPLEVVFRGGNYYFEESLKFATEDSGIEGYPVTYRAYSNEDVKFKGSKKLDLTKADEVTDTNILARIRDGFKTKVRVIDLSEQGIAASQICTPADTTYTFKLDYNREFNGFYINGKSMDVSCWPNGGDEATYTFNESDAVNKFTYTDDAPDRWGKAKNWWVTIFNMYDYIPLRLKAASVDTANNVIYTGNSNGNVNTTIANPYTPTWKAYNLLEEIDLPGEYHIDIENMKLYFLPPCDLEGATAEIDVIGNPVITLQETENITFRGIEFSQINDDGVVMTDVNNIDVLGCTFRDIGYRGLAVRGTQEPKTVQYATGDKFPYGAALGEVPTANDASYNMDIRDNIFYNIGSSAIHLNGGNIDTLTPSNNVIENNFISKFAQNVYWDGVVVVGVGTKVKNNNISDAPYYAIRSYGNDHVIEYNEIYDVIKNSNDAAAIYSGASPIARGAVIQYNYLHDLKTWKETKNDWEYGIYFDDCQQGHTARYNIITDVNAGFMSNGAGNYTIVGNTIVDTSVGMKFAYNASAVPNSDTRAAVAERIYDTELYYSKYSALADYVNGTSPKASSTTNENIFSNVDTMFEYANQYGTTQLKSLSQEKDATFSNNNSVSTGIFVNPEGGDYRVKNTYASTYPYALNENFNIEKIGMTTNLTLNAQTVPFGISYPANGATAIETDGLWLSWEDAFGASKYRVVVATDTAFSNPIYNDIVPCSALNLTDVVTLSEDTTYYWKVTAINPSRDFGAEWQSEVGSFSTIGTSIENMTLTGNTVTADIYTYGNTISGSVEAMCYIASYDENNKLIEAIPQEITLEVGKRYPYTGNFENFVKEKTYSVRMYVWTKGYIPITDMATYIIPKEEQ